MSVPSDTTNPSLPTTPETFRLPLGMRVLSWFSLIVFSGLCVLCVFSMLWPELGPAGWGHPVGAVIFGGFAVLGVVAVWASGIALAIDTDGITTKMIGFSPKTLLWGEIRRLRERGGHLELRDGPGDSVVKVPYHLQDFERVRDIILTAATGLALGAEEESPHLLLPTTFRRELVALWVTLGLNSLLLPGMAVGLFFVPTGVAVICVVALIGLSYELSKEVFDWYYLTVFADKIRLRSPLRLREVEFAQIVSMEVQIDYVRGHGATAVLNILHLNLADGTTLKLRSFRNQPLAIRLAIESAMKRSTTAVP